MEGANQEISILILEPLESQASRLAWAIGNAEVRFLGEQVDDATYPESPVYGGVHIDASFEMQANATFSIKEDLCSSFTGNASTAVIASVNWRESKRASR